MKTCYELTNPIRQVLQWTCCLATVLILTPFSYGATVLQDLVGNLRTGEWAELQTIGFNGGAVLLSDSAVTDYITQYTDKAVWNPVTKELFVIGQAHGYDHTGAFVKYGEACNCWTILPLTGIGPPNHAYDHLSINPSAGKIYYRQYGVQTIWQYDLGANRWSVLTTTPISYANSVGALEYFPEVNGIVYLDGDWGLFLYDLNTGQWQRLALTNVGSGHKMGSYDNVMRYNPITHQVVFGGGISYGDPNDGKRLYALSSNLQITALPLAPYTIALSGPTISAIFVPDPVTGHFLLYATADSGVTGAAYELDTTALTWAQLPSSVYPPFFHNSVDGAVFGTVATAIPEYGVVAFIDYEWPPNGKVLLYKHAAGLGHVPPVPPPTGIIPPPPAPAGPPAAATDFQSRCAAAGVILCNGFDSASDIAGIYGDNKGTLPGAAVPAIDTTAKASGAGSLKFTIPSNSAANTSGVFFTNFSKDLSVQFGENSEFYVQWRQRFSAEFLSTFYQGGGGWKQAIITTGDKPGCTASSSATGFCYGSCTAIEVVAQNTYQRGFAQLYNSCTGSASHGAYASFDQVYGAADFKLQNARAAPYCLYSQSHTSPITSFPPQGNCFGYFPNEWMTFQIHVRTGLRVGDEFSNSHVDMWIAREGKPSEQVFSWGPYNLSAGPVAENQRYGKIWLLPYDTNKDPNQVHPVGYTWYDELIVSRQKIADPK